MENEKIISEMRRWIASQRMSNAGRAGAVLLTDHMEHVFGAEEMGKYTCRECARLGYKCPRCYAAACLCGGVGCNSCEPRG
jgi:hypothetical protein